MKLKEIHLKKFKRFTDLTITAIPSSARLVVLVGPEWMWIRVPVFDALRFGNCGKDIPASPQTKATAIKLQ